MRENGQYVALTYEGKILSLGLAAFITDTGGGFSTACGEVRLHRPPRQPLSNALTHGWQDGAPQAKQRTGKSWTTRLPSCSGSPTLADLLSRGQFGYRKLLYVKVVF